jgi:hypothetical protein
LSAKVNLSYSNCGDGFGFAVAVTVPAACQATGASPLHLKVMYNSATSIAATVTLTGGCTITAVIPGLSCTLTFSGEQRIGNGTSGTGGIGVTDGTSTIKTVADLNNTTVPSVVSSGGGFGCPSAGAHAGTVSGACGHASVDEPGHPRHSVTSSPDGLLGRVLGAKLRSRERRNRAEVGAFATWHRVALVDA